MRDVLLILHFIGIALAFGGALAHLFLVKSGKGLEEKTAGKVIENGKHSLMLIEIGLTVLLISGGGLMTPYWAVLGSMPGIMLKLVFAVVFTVFMVLLRINSKKAMLAGGAKYRNKALTLSGLLLTTGILTVLAAVLAFH